MPSRWMVTCNHGGLGEVVINPRTAERAREIFEDRKAALPAEPGAFVRLTCDGQEVDEWRPEIPPHSLPRLAPEALRGLKRLVEHVLTAPNDTFGAQRLDVLAACLWIRQAELRLAAEREAQ